jgi:PAS domain S-box-containing protein
MGSDVSTLAPQFGIVLETVPDATIVTDRLGRMVLVNSQAEALFGFARGELLGQAVEMLIPARFRSAHPAHRHGYFQDPRTRAMGAGKLELYGLRRDGTEFPVEISLSPLETEDGALAITAIRDITERKRVEEERARLHRELERLLADQNRFFTNVSHELRTPLSLVLGPAEKLLAATGPEGPGRADLEVIVRNARTVLRHVNDLLDVARIEAGRVPVDLVETDVSRLVRMIASHFESLAAERRVAFRVEAPEPLPRTLDAPKFQRIVLNLLSNAFKFTPAGGAIRCSLREGAAEEESPGGLVLEVSDSGPGVPREHRDSIFLRFHQLDSEGRPGGTGLGLSIAKEFTLLHRGTISVDDAPEGGARFRVAIPRLDPPPSSTAAAPAGAADAARDAADALRPRPRPSSAERSGLPRVLVVEDHPEMGAFVRDVLSAQASVALATGGREGLELALSLRPDLVVTDLMMSEGSGEDLVRAVRARRELDDVPILVLTARADDEIRVRLLREGAQDYLMKPFAAEELQARAAGLVATRRARDLLRREVDSQSRDLETLARELGGRKRDLEAALDAAGEARDEATRASRVKSDFLALVSHELRTPLAAMDLAVSRLASDPQPSERHRTALPRLAAANRRLTALVEALLEHSRIASGRAAPRREPVDAGRLVDETAWELRPLAEEKGLWLRVEVPGGLAPVETDPALLRVVVSNLIGNAVKFTTSGGVQVTVSASARELAIAVGDTGPGIPEPERDRIFQPFEQLDPIRAKHVPGVGLGLALVREVCAALGARVALRSEVGVGSTFTVGIPIVREEPGLASRAPQAPRPV